VSEQSRDGEGGSVKSAQRTLAILELFTQTRGALTFTEISEALGYPRSSLHNLLRTVVQSGWAELDPVTRRYTLGIRAWQAGNAYLRAVDLAERARPYMERVRDAFADTVQLAVRDGRYNVYVAKVEGSQLLVLASAIGRRLEAHATGVGKVLLADLATEERQALLYSQPLERFTPHTITEPVALEREFATIRARGHSLDREEYTLGVRCVAAPVRDHTGRVVAGMSVSVPSIRFRAERIEQARALLAEACGSLSAALGWTDAPATADSRTARRPRGDSPR